MRDIIRNEVHRYPTLDNELSSQKLTGILSINLKSSVLSTRRVKDTESPRVDKPTYCTLFYSHMPYYVLVCDAFESSSSAEACVWT